MYARILYRRDTAILALSVADARMFDVTSPPTPTPIKQSFNRNKNVVQSQQRFAT